MGTANTCWHLEIWAGVFTFFIRQPSQFPTLFGCSTISKCNFYFSIYLINLINWQMLNRFPLINATNFSWLNNKWINIFCLVFSLKPIFLLHAPSIQSNLFMTETFDLGNCCSWPQVHNTDYHDMMSAVQIFYTWCQKRIEGNKTRDRNCRPQKVQA